MKIEIMTPFELVRYAKPSTELEHALLDALRENANAAEQLAEIKTVLSFFDLSPDVDKLDDALAALNIELDQLKTENERLELLVSEKAAL
jgi:predicted  nucleic acid-binding Zn-ribbon protein